MINMVQLWKDKIDKVQNMIDRAESYLMLIPASYTELVEELNKDIDKLKGIKASLSMAYLRCLVNKT